MDKKEPKSSLEQQIDQNLRKVYQQTADEEIPDRFMDLLKQLKDQESENDR